MSAPAADRLERYAAAAAGLGDRLRRRRLDLHLTQEELARRADTSQAVIQKIENGKSLRPRILGELAAVLDVTPWWLSHGAGPVTPSGCDVARQYDLLSVSSQRAVRRALATVLGRER